VKNQLQATGIAVKCFLFSWLLLFTIKYSV
jgi:hypothetical protein